MSNERRAARHLRRAAPDKVVEAIARLATRPGTWPMVGNSSAIYGYKLKILLKAAFENDVSASDARLLAEYLAHSANGHLFDGWRYLSQALLALALGSGPKATHLAYYAELRAACSILASSGVGIFDNQNFTLDSDGKVHWFAGRTHQTTWYALKAWATRPDTAANFFSLFQLSGLDGRQWAQACDASGTGDDIPATWIQEWAVDLNRVSEDQNARNLASYNPSLAKSAFNSVAPKDIELLTAIFRSTVAISSGVVRDLDAAIIQKLCELFKERSGVTESAFWQNVVNRLITSFGKPVTQARSTSAAARQSLNKSTRLIFKLAAGPNGDRASAHNVICRGLLLLRLASSLVRRRWHEASNVASTSIVESRRDRILHSFAVGSNNLSASTTLTGLLSVSSDELKALAEIEKQLISASFSGDTLWASCGAHIANLARVERLCIRCVA